MGQATKCCIKLNCVCHSMQRSLSPKLNVKRQRCLLHDKESKAISGRDFKRTFWCIIWKRKSAMYRHAKWFNAMQWCSTNLSPTHPPKIQSFYICSVGLFPIFDDAHIWELADWEIFEQHCWMHPCNATTCLALEPSWPTNINIRYQIFFIAKILKKSKYLKDWKNMRYYVAGLQLATCNPLSAHHHGLGIHPTNKNIEILEV